MTGVLCNVKGTYSVEGNFIIVILDFEGTVFIDNENAETYIPVQHIFEIVHDDEIVIDKDFYIVSAGDSFIR